MAARIGAVSSERQRTELGRCGAPGERQEDREERDVADRGEPEDVVRRPRQGKAELGRDDYQCGERSGEPDDEEDRACPQGARQR